MPQRNPTENVVYLGSSIGSGYVVEMATENLSNNTALLTGVAVAGVGFMGNMFVRNPMLQNAMDGISAGTLGWVGSKVKEENMITNLFGAGGAINRRPVRIARQRANNSGQNRSSNNTSSNVVEM